MATPIPGGENFINYSSPMSLSLQFEKEVTSFLSSKSQQKVSSTDEMKALVSLESSFQQAIGIDDTSAHSYSTNVSELNIYSSTNTTSAYHTTAISDNGERHTLAYPSDDGGCPPPLPPPEKCDPYNWIPTINRYGNKTDANTNMLMDMLKDTQCYQLPPPKKHTTAITDDGGYHTTAINEDGGGCPPSPPPPPPFGKCDPYNWIPTINRYGNATGQNINNLMGMLWQTQCYQLPNTRYSTDV